MNKNKRADGILLDYVLGLNMKGYWITSKPNPFLNGVDIMVRKHNLTYQQSIPFDILNKVNIAKEDMPLSGLSIHIDFPQEDKVSIPEITWTTESFVTNTVKRWIKENQKYEKG